MPQAQDRNQQFSTEELFEAALTGPFGGVQSELPPTEIEAFGFSDALNVQFWKGAAYNRFGMQSFFTVPGASEPLVGVASFYDINGNPHQDYFTPTRLFDVQGAVLTQITGPAMNSGGRLFSWDSLNYKLCFANGTNQLALWDGIAATYSDVVGSPNPATYVAEIGQHLFVVSPTFPQRYYWSGIGDPTDWTSFSSGLNDLVNNLGPITGLIKLGQYGYGFHQNGIVQIIPTGIGIAPFAFYPIINGAIGAVCPYSIAHFDDQGQEYAVYVGQDNVYLFNGSSITSIGDMPIAGDRRRLGARSRIMSDIQTNNPLTIQGVCSYSCFGQPYRAYWLLTPANVWVYNFDEGNWTRFVFNFAPTTLGGYRSLITSSSNVFTVSFGSNANGIYFANSTLACEASTSLVSGKLIFGDRRHLHTIKKFRISFIDLGSSTVFTIRLVNEKGQFQNVVLPPLGTGSGDVLNYVQEFNLTGLRFQYTITTPANSQTAIVELAPMYQVAGEQRGGTVEN